MNRTIEGNMSSFRLSCFSRCPEWKASLFVAGMLALLLTAGCPADRRSDQDAEVEPDAAAEPEQETAAEAVERPSAEPAAGPEATDQLGPPSEPPSSLVSGEGNLYGILRTNHGSIVVRFFEEEAPVAVANFVGLATGQVPYKNPETGDKETGSFYDGTIFHRVIPDFMIQGGDPTGTGRSGPGYRFDDERQELEFDRPGLLAMANAGPNTNGSQFFITERAVPHLTGRHTIFGTVESGMDVVNAIARVERGAMDRPSNPVVLERVEVRRATEPPTP